MYMCMYIMAKGPVEKRLDDQHCDMLQINETMLSSLVIVSIGWEVWEPICGDMRPPLM